jgi:nucleotide-binding universal stress UspA family protein
VAGLALARELTMIEAVLKKPEPPFAAIVAGTRIEEKLPIMENLLPKLNRLFIGGTLAFKFLKAKGQEIGAARVSEDLQPLVVDFLRKAEKKVDIVFPQDFIVVKADEFRAYEEGGRRGTVPASRRVLDTKILPSDFPVDIGPWTVNRIKGLFDGANTIFWNGPLGIWEVGSFGAGTREVAKLIAERVSPRYQRSILCGDSLSHAIQTFGPPIQRIHHLTAGGESALQMLAGNPLPAVSALDDEIDLVARIEPRPRRILLPVDGSEHSLEAARKLGRLLNVQGAQISLLHVADGAEQATGQIEAQQIFSATNAALAGQGLTSHHQLIVEGNPADEILRLADEMGADLIAMGSHGRTGVLRLLMGSVSRKVLDQARCPVLIVRIPDEEMAKAGMLEMSGVN